MYVFEAHTLHDEQVCMRQHRYQLAHMLAPLHVLCLRSFVYVYIYIYRCICIYIPVPLYMYI